MERKGFSPSLHPRLPNAKWRAYWQTTVEPHHTPTPLIRPPCYYDHFLCPEWKPSHFLTLQLHPVDQTTPLLRPDFHDSMVEFHCTVKRESFFCRCHVITTKCKVYLESTDFGLPTDGAINYSSQKSMYKPVRSLVNVYLTNNERLFYHC